MATSETGADLYYAVGTPASMGDLPSDAARLYTGPLAVVEQTELHFAAFDPAGNVTSAVGTYAPRAAAPADLAAPTTVTATAGQESATVRWTAVAGAAGYRVTATATGTTGPARTVQTTALTAAVPGLTAGTTYGITVATANSAGSHGSESTPVTATPTRVVDRLTVSSARSKPVTPGSSARAPPSAPPSRSAPSPPPAPSSAPPSSQHRSPRPPSATSAFACATPPPAPGTPARSG